jgi:hypothetical protein
MVASGASVRQCSMSGRGSGPSVMVSNDRSWSSLITGLIVTVISLVISAIIIATVNQIIVNTSRISKLESEVESIKVEVHRHLDNTRIPNP